MCSKYALVGKHQKIEIQFQKLSLDVPTHIGQHTCLEGDLHPIFVCSQPLKLGAGFFGIKATYQQQ